MNVQERLLRNEIQSLGQMIQIVSYELTLLSDFMREKFGSSFESFRERHSEQQANIIPQQAEQFSISKKKNNVTARKSTSPLQRKRQEQGRQSGSESAHSTKRLKISDEGDEDASDDEYEGNENEMSWDLDKALDPVDDDSVGAMDKDSSLSEDEYDKDLSSDIPKGAQLVDFSKPKDPDEKMQGRARSTIWSKYIVSKLPDGKLFAKCPRCKNPVSCKVERLTKHYQKCVKQTRNKVNAAVGKQMSDTATAIEEQDKRKVAEYIKAVNKKSGDGSGGDVDGDNNRDPLDTESTISNKQNEQMQEIKFDQGASSGRRADPVWEYFTVLEDPETKRRIVRCKRCCVPVSAKVDRVRRHFVMCRQLDKEGDVHID